MRTHIQGTYDPRIENLLDGQAVIEPRRTRLRSTEDMKTEKRLLDGGAVVQARGSRGTEDLRTWKNLTVDKEAPLEGKAQLISAIDIIANVLIDTKRGLPLESTVPISINGLRVDIRAHR